MNDSLQKLTILASDLINELETRSQEITAQQKKLEKDQQTLLERTQDITRKQQALLIQSQQAGREVETAKAKMAEALKIKQIAEQDMRNNGLFHKELEDRERAVLTKETAAQALQLQKKALEEAQRQLNEDRAVLKREQQLNIDKHAQLTMKEQQLNARELRIQRLATI